MNERDETLMLQGIAQWKVAETTRRCSCGTKLSRTNLMEFCRKCQSAIQERSILFSISAPFLMTRGMGRMDKLTGDCKRCHKRPINPESFRYCDPCLEYMRKYRSGRYKRKTTGVVRGGRPQIKKQETI